MKQRKSSDKVKYHGVLGISMKRKILIPIKNYLSEWDSVGFFNAELSIDDKFSGIIGRKEADSPRKILHQFPFEIDYLEDANAFVEKLYGWDFEYSEIPPHLEEQIQLLDDYGLKTKTTVSIKQGEESTSYHEELSHTLEGVLNLKDEALDVWGIVDTWEDHFDLNSSASYKREFRQYIETKIAFFTQEVNEVVKNTSPSKISYHRKIGFTYPSPVVKVKAEDSLFGSEEFEPISITITLEIVANYR
jgi:hypothetical protein